MSQLTMKQIIAFPYLAMCNGLYVAQSCTQYNGYTETRGGTSSKQEGKAQAQKRERETRKEAEKGGEETENICDVEDLQ